MIKANGRVIMGWARRLEMKILLGFLTLFILMSCASKEMTWDSGAQRQESMQDQNINDQQDQLRNQFGGRSY
jgi:hypothetical protein